MKIEFDKPIPFYLNEKRNIVRLVVFTSLFALVFINLYSPFGSDSWFNVSKLEFFTYSSLIILTGVLVVVISRIILYGVNRRSPVLLSSYLLWIAAEVLSMSLFYALFEMFILDDTRPFVTIIKATSWNTALVLLLPYSVLWLYFSWKDKQEQIQRLTEMNAHSGSTKDMIPFYDDKGVLKFSVKKENLLYLESEENYISICYLNKGKVSKFLLRETLKKVGESFVRTDIIRCHRSFMVNFEKVKVIRREKDGLMLELDTPSVADIPVSKTYVHSVMQTFSDNYKLGESAE
jgi:hypothetical protein